MAKKKTSKKYQIGGETKQSNLEWGQLPDIQGNLPQPPIGYTIDENGNIIDIKTGQIVGNINQQNQMNKFGKAELIPTNRPNPSFNNTLAPRSTPDVTYGTEQKKDTFGNLTFSDEFKQLNAAMDITTGIGNFRQNIRTKRDEQRDYLRSIQSRPRENKDEEGLNNIPVYYQMGGKNSKYGALPINPSDINRPALVNGEIHGMWNERFVSTTAPKIKKKPIKSIKPIFAEQPYAVEPAYETTRPNLISKDTIQSGNIIYGPSNGAIGYINKRVFSPINRRDHLAKANQADIDLLNNPEALDKYVKTSPRYQTGGVTVNPILAEAGEIYESTDGNINKIPDHMNTHDEAGGGVPIFNASRVLEDTGDKRKDIDSKLLRLSPDELFNITGAKSKKSVTHSKAFEIASEQADKRTKKIENVLKRNVEDIDSNSNNNFAKNSLDLNLNRLEEVPTKIDLFNSLFEHQETIKDLFSIEQGEAKDAKYGINMIKAQNGVGQLNFPPINPKPSGYGTKGLLKKKLDWFNTETGQTVPLTYEGLKQARQNVVNNYPEFIQDYYNPSATGEPVNNSLYNRNKTLTNVTAQELNKNYLDIDPRTGRPIFGHEVIVPKPIHFKTEAEKQAFIKDKRPVNRGDQPVGYADPNTKGLYYIPTVDGIEPMQPIQPTPAFNTNLAARNTPDVTPGVNPNTAPGMSPYKQPDNPFFQPLNWYDVATPIAGLLSGVNRIGAKYNPINLERPKAKYLNPLPTLQAGQTDYNAAMDILPQNGVGMGNLTSLFGKKYAANNNVLGSYENANNQIWTQNEAVRADIGNRQEVADQQARAVFEQQRLGSIEAQRQQLLRSMDDLTTRFAQNAKLNREGNLLMKLFPAFNQQGNYNGYKYNVTAPNSQNSTQQKLEQLEAMGIKLSPSQRLAIIGEQKKSRRK